MVEFVEKLWEMVYEFFGRDHWKLYLVGSWLVNFTVFVSINTVFGLLDVFGVPSILKRYKIQKARNVPVEMRKYLWTTVVATFNMTVTVLCVLQVTWWTLARHRMNFHPSTIPTLWRALAEMLVCVLLHEIAFYYNHRLLHKSAFLFKHIHKTHHEWKAPCTMATYYCHPLEQALVNMGTFVLGPALVGAHLSTTWLYWAVGNASTLLAHSGYHLPLLPSPQSHDFHHDMGVDQYSTIGLLDWLHSTNRHFKRSQNSKRHLFLWGLTPADKLVKL